MENFRKFCEELTLDIQKAYESSPTIEEAEKLAAKFLLAQIKCGEALSSADLASRMRKNGLKAVKAAVYMQHATKTEKKPSDVLLQALVDQDQLVNTEQEGFDVAEVESNELKNFLSVCRDAHIYFRGMSRGRYD